MNEGHSNKVIVGAHYDVYGEQDGADDNASGVAGTIEVARLLAQEKARLKQNIEFVFYTLEEPPFFRTEHMGSFIHAQSIYAQKNEIKGVYILEMIGYFDSNKVQKYPLGLKWFYPSPGNFIATVSNFQSRRMGREYCNAVNKQKVLECRKLVAPSFIKGVDFSDHLNYWQLDIPAMMITDTSFYCNYHYHTDGDRIEKLNVKKMADVVNGLAVMLLEEN